MVFYMKLQDEPFKMVKSGQKTLENRLWDSKRQGLNPGDTIVFSNVSNENERVVVLVKELYRYNSFWELFSNPSLLEQSGFTKDITAKDAAKKMLKFYSETEEQSYGVVGIRIELVP